MKETKPSTKEIVIKKFGPSSLHFFFPTKSRNSKNGKVRSFTVALNVAKLVHKNISRKGSSICFQFEIYQNEWSFGLSFFIFFF